MLGNLLKVMRNRNYGRLKHSTQVKFFTTENQTQETDEFAAKGQRNKMLNEVLAKYSEQEVDKILEIVNNYSSQQLLGYNITKNRASKLLEFRLRNGLLTHLKDILLVEGFGIKIADKFYQSLLEEPKILESAEQIKLTKTAPFITPSIDLKHQSNIKSCVAVRIGVNSITWSKLELSPTECNDPCQLTHWQNYDIAEKKMHINDLIQRCLYLTNLIPEADCYLFENPKTAVFSNNPGSVDQQNINIQKAQVTAMIGYALAARNSTHDEDTNIFQNRPVLFYVRRFLTARLFNHLVGTERVSSEQIILDMMRTYYNPEDLVDFDKEENAQTEEIDSGLKVEQQKKQSTLRGNVQFPMEFRQMFSNASRYHREFLGQALLLNLTFIRLVLLRDAMSIALVTRGGRNKSNIKEVL